jgi:nitrite reductase (NO-forming)
VEFKVDVPGAYLLVDHSIFRVAKGAVGILSVSGEDNPSIFNAMNPQ